MKEIIGADFSHFESIKDKGIQLRKPLVIPPDMNLLDLLKEFRNGKSHMAFITEEVENLQLKFGLTRSNSILPKNLLIKQTSQNNNKPKILGIITLEDVIEEMINIDIRDEDDYDKEKKKDLEKIERVERGLLKGATCII